MKEKASDVHIKDSKFLGGDAFRIAFLTILYMIQGICFGFLGNTLPVRFRKTFDYVEIGTISWCFLPYSFKFILAPLVDTIYSKWIGKRRTWIIPTQLIMCGIVYYFSYYLKDLIEEKSIFLITICFTIILCCCALQDISIDGWCVTIVKEENAKYSALAQITGINLGVFVSTTVFFAFNSLDFCKSYLYLEESEVSPIIDEFSFMKYWSIIIFAISLYTILFSSETKDRIKYEEREIGIIEAISRIFILLGNKKILKLILLFIVVLMFSNVNAFLGTIYLLEDLKYSQSKYSFVTLFVFPINVVLSIIIMKIASQKVLNTFMGITILRAVNDLVFVNILLYFAFDGFIFDILIFITLTISNFSDIGMLAGVISYGNLVCDLEIASTHLTFIFSMFNLANMIPKFYTHFFVMKFGIFLPNAIGCVATIIITIIAYQFYQNPKMYSRIKTSKEHLKTD